MIMKAKFTFSNRFMHNAISNCIVLLHHIVVSNERSSYIGFIILCCETMVLTTSIYT